MARASLIANDQLPSVAMADSDERSAADAGYTMVGFLVLGFQRFQVKRRALEREASSVAQAVVRHSSEWLGERDSDLDR